MKKITNFKELNEVLDKNVLERCTFEYLTILMAKAQRLDDLRNHIELLAKKSNGEMPLKSGELLGLLNMPLFTNMDDAIDSMNPNKGIENTNRG